MENSKPKSAVLAWCWFILFSLAVTLTSASFFIIIIVEILSLDGTRFHILIYSSSIINGLLLGLFASLALHSFACNHPVLNKRETPGWKAFASLFKIIVDVLAAMTMKLVLDIGNNKITAHLFLILGFQSSINSVTMIIFRRGYADLLGVISVLVVNALGFIQAMHKWSYFSAVIVVYVLIVVLISIGLYDRPEFASEGADYGPKEKNGPEEIYIMDP